MKWKISWLAKQPNQRHVVNETLTFEKDMFSNVSNIDSVSQVSVLGFVSLSNNEVNIDIECSGIYYLPCAITNEIGEYPFSFSINTLVDDSFVSVVDFKADYIDLLEFTWQQLIVEAPTRFVKNDIDNKSGKSWQLITEDEYNNISSNQIDPRLEKLKDLVIEDKED